MHPNVQLISKTHAMTFILSPVFASLATTKQTAPSATAPPQKHIAASKDTRLINCPATGVPTNNPDPPIAKHMPILVPTTLMLELKVTNTVGGKLTNDPEKKP